ncbi:hypothetical protein L208DRAFT_1517056, partial [Tricholoma matsutake]
MGTFYMQHKGVLPAYSVHLYCDACHTNYHHNFHIKNGVRTYYDGLPDVIQVGEHQFVEQRVIQLWRDLMLVSWTSATNCTQMYNDTLSKNNVPPTNWAFGFKLKTDDIWDGFMILSLLKDCHGCQESFEVPHTGAQKDWFTAAIKA